MLIVSPDDRGWPSLGPQVAAWIEANLVFGPGDLLGEPARLSNDWRGILYRLYEVYPRSHALAGRRRFKRALIGLPKGTGKSEFLAWIAAAELALDSPVRTVAWQGETPIGGPVKSAYVPMIAATQEQSEDLAYYALKEILAKSRIAKQFIITELGIRSKDGANRANALAGSPTSRDGALTSFAVVDESHHLSRPGSIKGFQTLVTGLAKRKTGDGWLLEVSTAFEPGVGSVCEVSYNYGMRVLSGEDVDPSFFLFWRASDEHHDLNTTEGLRAAIVEARGKEAASWADIDAIAKLYNDPAIDKAWFRRVYLNQLTRSSDRAFDMLRFTDAGDSDYEPKQLAAITIGLDGSRFSDSTAIVCTEISTSFQWLAGLWENDGKEGWEVDAAEVDAVIDDLFTRYNVIRMYCDPAYWQSEVAMWAGRYGNTRVFEWWTNRHKAMAQSIRAYNTAIHSGMLIHSGDKDLIRHAANSFRKLLTFKDEDGTPLWIIYKERPHSPNKIDAIMAAILSWEARNDSIAAGYKEKRPSVYETQGISLV